MLAARAKVAATPITGERLQRIPVRRVAVKSYAARFARQPLDVNRDELGKRVAEARRVLWEGDLDARREWLADPKEDEPLRWSRMYARLKEWYGQHGHCDVPVGHPQFPELGSWVAEQRDRVRRGSMSPVRALKLENLGFMRRGAVDHAWDTVLRRLESFRAAEGHCDVPLHYGADPRLGLWLHQQRQYALAGLLQPQQVAALERLGAIPCPTAEGGVRRASL
jgi:hypothetical protein